MQEWLEGVFGLVATKKMLPFVCLAGTKPELNTARIIEALIIAGFSGLIGGLLAAQVTISKVEERVSSQSREIAEIKADIGKIKGDIYVPVGRGQ